MLLSSLFLIFCSLGIIMGLMMLLVPDDISRAGRGMQDKFSAMPLMRALETPYYLERIVYRHHRIFGLLIVLGALWSLVELLHIAEHRQALLKVMFPGWPRSMAALALDCGAIFLVLGTSFSSAVGLLIFIRPSILKGLETRANQWVASHQWLSTTAQADSDTSTKKNLAPRALGLIILLLSLLGLLKWSLVDLLI